MIEEIALLDTETTGLDPAVDHCIEVAVIVYSVKHATVMQAFSSLIRCDSNAAEHINRIPASALKEDAFSNENAFEVVINLIADVDAIIAHNAEFDRGFVPASIRDFKPWICSKRDLDWPKANRPGDSLVNLALAHDLGVAYAHRAMADCDLLARLFTRVHEMGVDLQAFLARGLRPKAKFQALVSFEEKDLAKAAGFQWEQAMRIWTRTLAIDDAAVLPFETKRIEP